MITLLNLIIIAYLIGSITSAVLVCRLAKQPDPRQQGSGNPGTTNVLRLTSSKIAAWVLLIDVAKGALPVLLGRYFELPSLALISLCLAAMLGHIYPIFFDFKGGKGVATLFGGIFVCSPWVGVCCLVTWSCVAWFWRYASLAAIATALLLPLYVAIFLNLNAAAMSLLLSATLIIKHRENITRLIQGTENRLFDKN